MFFLADNLGRRIINLYLSLELQSYRELLYVQEEVIHFISKLIYDMGQYLDI